MKAFAALFFLSLGGFFLAARAQVPQQSVSGKNPTFISYRDTPKGKVPDLIFTGAEGHQIGPQKMRIDQFQMKRFRNGDASQVEVIAQAPHCNINTATGEASDEGPIKIFTPTTNLYVEGVGFFFTRTNQFLMISNQVMTRVLKTLIKTPMLGAARTNSTTPTITTNAPQYLRIFAERGRFDFRTNVVNYSGHVHVIDPQLDLTSKLLSIEFNTNGTVRNIFAQQNVVITTTNNGTATGASAFYWVTNANESMKLTGDAFWRNGDEEAKANQFTYDSGSHILTGTGHVRVRWPNPGGAPPRPTNSAPLLLGTNGYRELFGDFVTLQFPPTNGPIESMFARGNVIIVNQADQSRALAEQAVYQKVTDTFALTGEPVWWNDQMEVKGQLLLADLGQKTYHARKEARLKMRTGSGVNNKAASPGHATNQWIFVSSTDMDYQTNLATFNQNVTTRFVENGALMDTLNCRVMTVDLVSNQLKTMIATGHVTGETAPDTNGMKKTLSCDLLTVHRSVETGLIKTIVAEDHVIIEEVGKAPTAPHNTLKADIVTVYFSPTTNEVDHVIADRNVVLQQIKGTQTIHATAKHAVYTAGTTDQVKLTGAPLANTDKYLISDSDFMIWKPKANRFQAYGPYKIVPIKTKTSQHSL